MSFDFDTPRKFYELKPVRTPEVRFTDATPHFMMKEGYDVARRTLTKVLIQDEPASGSDAPPDDHNDGDENELLVDWQHPEVPIPNGKDPTSGAGSPQDANSSDAYDPERDPRFDHW